MEKVVSMVVALAALTSPSAAKSEPFVLGPPNGDGPVVVRASFEVRDINDIDDEAGVDEKIYQGGYQFNELSPGWFPQVVLVNESGLFEKHGVILRVQPDGTSTLVETVNAVAEADLDLRRYPFDRHRLEATFEVLGTDNAEVELQAESETGSPSVGRVRMPQWSLSGVTTSTRERPASYAGGGRPS
jgi:hypothetical protein